MTQITPSRRDLLLAGVSGVAAAALPAAARAADASTQPAGIPDSTASRLPGVLKLSIAGYSFREFLDKANQPGRMSLFDLVDMAAGWGLDAIEPTSYYFLRDDDAYIIALKRKAYLAGLEISGTPVGNNFCKQGEELAAEKAKVRTWIDHAMLLGSPAIRIFAGSPQRGVDREKLIDQVVSSIRECCDYAGQRGVFLAIENHGYLTETADDVIRLIKTVNHPWLGANLDTGNFQDEPYASIEKLAPYAVACQFKAMVRNPQTKQQEPADYGRMVKILRAAKYRGYVALEYEGKDPHTHVPKHLEQIRAAMRSEA